MHLPLPSFPWHVGTRSSQPIHVFPALAVLRRSLNLFVQCCSTVACLRVPALDPLCRAPVARSRHSFTSRAHPSSLPQLRRAPLPLASPGTSAVPLVPEHTRTRDSTSSSHALPRLHMFPHARRSPYAPLVAAVALAGAVVFSVCNRGARSGVYLKGAEPLFLSVVPT